MIVRIVALACLVIPAAKPAGQDAPSASPKESISEAEVSRLLAELAQKAGAIDSFVATYRVEEADEGQEHVMVLSYDAPDRARLESRRPDVTNNLWLLDGRMYMRGEFGQGGIKAEIELDEIFTFGDGFETALREAFPVAEDGSDDLGAGPVFGLDVVPDESQPSGYAVNASLAWNSRRTHVLTWLSNVEGWTGASRYEKRLVREVGGDAAIGLSLESGFVDEIRLSKSMRLVDLRVNEDVPESVFVVPSAEPGARDVSAELSLQQLRMASAMARNKVYVRAAKRTETAGIEDAALRAKMQTVFRELHAVVLIRHYGDWIEETKRRSAASIQEWTEKFREQVRNDPSAREQLRLRSTAERESLVHTLDKAREAYVASLRAPALRRIDAGLLGAIAAVERNGASDAYERDVATPVLRDFDEGLKAAIGDK